MYQILIPNMNSTIWSQLFKYWINRSNFMAQSIILGINIGNLLTCYLIVKKYPTMFLDGGSEKWILFSMEMLSKDNIDLIFKDETKGRVKTVTVTVNFSLFLCTSRIHCQTLSRRNKHNHNTFSLYTYKITKHIIMIKWIGLLLWIKCFTFLYHVW